MTEKTETLVLKDKQSSMTIGSPTKGGEIKVYFNPDKPDETKALIDNALAALQYALEAKSKVTINETKL